VHLDQLVLVGNGAVDDEEDVIVVVVDLGALAELLRVLQSAWKWKTSRRTAKSASVDS
jgi:hypothetical protein